MGTDNILFTTVQVQRNSAQVLPLEVVPVPGHGAQIFARAPTKTLVRLVPVPENRERGLRVLGSDYTI